MLRKNEQLVEAKASTGVRLIHLVLLVGILFGATLLRVHALGKTSYWYDEICSVLYARGQTAAIFTAPQGYFEQAPAVASQPGTRPWRNVWLGFDTTPPLYPTLLRLWWHAFGESDISGRALSVALSVLTVAALFDLGRLILTPAMALWACALCAASPPMVRYAQEARSYALLGFFGVLVCDISIRIARCGGSTRRYLLLWLFCAAALLTHYFVAGGIAGIALFALVKLRGCARAKMVCVVAAACIVGFWALPILWIHAPSVHQGIDWLAEPRAGLLKATLFRIAWLPLEYLIRPLDNQLIVCIPAVVLLIIPLFLDKERPGLLLAGLWPLGIIGLVAASDLGLSHGALAYERYTLAAAPMVFVSLVAIADLGGDWIRHALPARAWAGGWLRHALPALALAGALLAVPTAYSDQLWIKPETRELAQDIREHVEPGDVLVIASRPLMGLYAAGVTYLNIDFYDGPMPYSAAILESPASGAIRRLIWSHKHVWVVRPFDGASGNYLIDSNGYIGPCGLRPVASMRLFAGRLYLAEPLTP